MPSDTSINLSTSATAAFCAKLLVYPLDNVKASIQNTKGDPTGIIPRLDHLWINIRQQLQFQQRVHEPHSQLPQQSSKYYYKERVSVWRGIYKGAPFALAFQVPALSIFLSTYDATKCKLAQMAHSADIPLFHLHHVETHLLSGMAAKAMGTFIWVPMNRIQGLSVHPTRGPMPLSLKDAYHYMMQICRSEGVTGLWSGYGSTFSALLPYTIIYFATYEQLKQIARWIEHSKGNGRPWDYAPALRDYCSHFGQPNAKVSKTQLTLDTYMMCVASAAVISSTVCQTATVLNTTLRGHLGLTQKSSTDHLRSVKRPVSLETVRMSLLLSPEISALSPLPSKRHFPSALSDVNFVGSSSFKSHPFVPPQFRTMTSRTSTVAGQALISLPWQQCQHATLTTTGFLPIRNTMGLHGLKGHVGLTIPWYPSIVSQTNVLILPAFSATTTALQRTPGSVMMIVPTPLAGAVLSSNDNEKTRVANNVTLSKTNQATGIFRTIARGLGPRILWTVPGVTMTTAGFEVLRSMAQGAQ